ncbi:VOC family protein [Dactylosporangium sp. NPDC005572]|uniref:VOC family protein n=1 Tax=Dactylosporangium sp. NPDC005572 TaxID=3156889 RepID=UPI0033BAE1F3
MGHVIGQGVRLLIFATDPDRVRAFYAQVFGWSLPDDGQRHCWVITSEDDPRLGIDGPIEIRAEHSGQVGIPTVHVADLSATTHAALTAGGEVLVPRIPLPGIGWLLYLADTEGNLVGVMQDDPQAASPPTPPASGRGPAAI